MADTTTFERVAKMVIERFGVDEERNMRELTFQNDLEQTHWILLN